ncbi:unnamed protein product, partial [Bubo scandiacus]
MRAPCFPRRPSRSPAGAAAPPLRGGPRRGSGRPPRARSPPGRRPPQRRPAWLRGPGRGGGRSGAGGAAPRSSGREAAGARAPGRGSAVPFAARSLAASRGAWPGRAGQAVALAPGGGESRREGRAGGGWQGPRCRAPPRPRGASGEGSGGAGGERLAGRGARGLRPLPGNVHL